MVLSFDELLEIERENDPLSADIYEMAQKLYGAESLISGSQKSQLNQLQGRADRLAPLRALQYGEAGSGRIQGNPYSIDSRGLMTGMSNLAVGLINRERDRRTQGDPKAVAKANERANTLTTELDKLKALPNPGKSELKKIEQLERQIGNQTRRAERYGGFAGELESLRELASKEDQREENIQKYIERVAPQQASAIFQDAVNERSDQRITMRQENAEKERHKNALELINARGYEDRLTLAERQKLENDPNSQNSKAIVFREIETIMNHLYPELKILPQHIQNLRVVERQLLAKGWTPEEDPELVAIQKNIKELEDSYIRTSQDAVGIFFEMRPNLRGKIDIDSILNNRSGNTTTGELDNL